MPRGFDILIALLALVVFSPVLLIAAVAIKLGSRGPVFYRQRRVGLNGEEFKMLKLRTMVAGSDPVGVEIDDGRLPQFARGAFGLGAHDGVGAAENLEPVGGDDHQHGDLFAEIGITDRRRRRVFHCRQERHEADEQQQNQRLEPRHRRSRIEHVTGVLQRGRRSRLRRGTCRQHAAQQSR